MSQIQKMLSAVVCGVCALLLGAPSELREPVRIAGQRPAAARHAHAPRHTRAARCDGPSGSSQRGSASRPGRANIRSFRVKPNALRPGETATLSWDVENADVVSVTPSVASLGQNSATIQPSSTTSYALNIAGPGGAAIQFLTVPVSVASAAPASGKGSSAAAGTPQAAAVSGDDKHPDGYTLVFADEFNGSSLDRTRWCTRYAYGGGVRLEYDDPGCTGPGGYSGTLDFLNSEQQRYVDHNSRGEAMHVVSGGVLQLRATRTRNDGWAAYESAMIRSKQEFKPTATTSYFITARVRLPNVKGSWPALWLVSGFGSNGALDWPPEVDIFEGALNGLDEKTNMLRIGGQVRGQQTSTGQLDITYTHPDYDRGTTNYAPARNLRDTWLVVGAEWTQSGLCYFVDGVRVMCENYRWVTNDGGQANPASVLLNLAIGGEWAGAAGIEDVFFPTGLAVDYLRVYRK